ncbi:MAG: hypothetical protein AAGC90_04895 [Curtobacterium sp.]|uniref:hypothetical protein n=1 Tax=unclassified Curtobacterium TaxID=257496 RepID=UPI0007D71F20|nr:hypothetical protein [Curtobacterium sp. 9128]SBN62106.1 hypothetical protein GA0004736_1005 [Curtobacterium sp. 9128]
MTTITSTAALVDDEWVLRCVDYPAIEHHGAWLDDVVVQHRTMVHDFAGETPRIEFVVGDPSTASRIAAVRCASERARAMRAEARALEEAVADDRDALVARLTELNVAPSEIAEILGLSVRAVRDELGSDEEARIARRILRTLHHADEPQPAEGQRD